MATKNPGISGTGFEEMMIITIGGVVVRTFTSSNLSIKGSRITRKVGSGTWSGAYAETTCVSKSQYDSSIPIAVKRHFRYENNECPEHDGAWIMHEFSLYHHDDEKTTTSFNSDDQLVVCRIRKKYDQAAGDKKNKKRNKFDHDHLEPTAVHSSKKMRLSDHSDIHDQVDDQAMRSTAETTPIIFKDLEKNNDYDLYDIKQLMH